MQISHELGASVSAQPRRQEAANIERHASTTSSTVGVAECVLAHAAAILPPHRLVVTPKCLQIMPQLWAAARCLGAAVFAADGACAADNEAGAAQATIIEGVTLTDRAPTLTKNRVDEPLVYTCCVKAVAAWQHKHLIATVKVVEAERTHVFVLC